MMHASDVHVNETDIGMYNFNAIYKLDMAINIKKILLFKNRTTELA